MERIELAEADEKREKNCHKRGVTNTRRNGGIGGRSNARSGERGAGGKILVEMEAVKGGSR